MPLNQVPTQQSITALTVKSMMPVIMASIDLAVVMLCMHNAAMEATRTKLSNKKKIKRAGNGNTSYPSLHSDEEELQHPHVKQLQDLVA